MEVSLTSGKAEGPNELNAFDNALLVAGIGDINLIKVSSILPLGTKIVEMPGFKVGEMVNCVIAQASSKKKGDRISAVIAVALSDELGCVVEHSGVNKDAEKVKNEAITRAKYMMEIRGKSIKKIIVEQENHIVKKLGVVIAAIVFLG
jgi:arginine decarboxylase